MKTCSVPFLLFSLVFVNFLVLGGEETFQLRPTEIALLDACQDGKVRVVERLLSKKAEETVNVNVHDVLIDGKPARKPKDYENFTSIKFGNTPLMYATLKGSTKIIELLLATGRLDVNLQRNDSLSAALHFAAYHDRFSIMKLLLGIPTEMRKPQNDDDVEDQHGEYEKESSSEMPNLAVDVNVKDRHSFTPLLYASQMASVGSVKLLLRRPDIDVNAKDEAGNSAIMHALLRKKRAVVKLLMEDPRVDLSVKDVRNVSLLHFAALHAEFHIMEQLLKISNESKIIQREASDQKTGKEKECTMDHRIIDVNAVDDQGLSPLVYATKANRSVAWLLIAHPEADVNIRDKKGLSVLFHAVRNGHVDIVKLLLGHKNIDVNAVGYDDEDQEKNFPKDDRDAVWTALMVAATMPYAVNNSLPWLLNHSAIKLHGQYGPSRWNALHLAARYGHYANVVEILQKRRQLVQYQLTNASAKETVFVSPLDLDAKTDFGWTALMMAARHGYASIVQVLLQEQFLHQQEFLKVGEEQQAIIRSRTHTFPPFVINVNVKDPYGWTALLLATKYRFRDTVYMLLRASTSIANRNAQNKAGDTSLHIALREGYPEIVHVFLDLDNPLVMNATAAMAKRLKSNSIFQTQSPEEDEELLRTRVWIDESLQNKAGDTILDIAQQRGDDDMLNQLLSFLHVRKQKLNSASRKLDRSAPVNEDL